MRKGIPQEGFRVLEPEHIPYSVDHFRGTELRKIIESVLRVVQNQKDKRLTKGIKGAIFYGTPGTGKTTVGQAIARRTNVRLIFVDGADIARPLYGEAENRVRAVFEEASKHGFAIVLIDDCESVFPSRSWVKGESWHVAQNNIFFHELDKLDTSHAFVILTTNRYDLMDYAVKDRLWNIEFPVPEPEALEWVAKDRAEDLVLDINELYDKGLREVIKKAKSVRDVEKFVTRAYLEHVAGGI